MQQKVTVRSVVYPDFFMGIIYNTESKICKIGGREKLIFECEFLISCYFNDMETTQNTYKSNRISRLMFTCEYKDFIAWIDKLQRIDRAVKFVDNLGRIMK